MSESKNELNLEQMKGKQILVAGAAGMIPGHLVRMYLQAGATVVGLDNLITGSEKTVEQLESFSNFRFFHTNVSEKLPDLSEFQFDYVFSLASPASPVDFKTIPMEIMRTNTLGTWNLLELAKEHKASFLQASTSEVYGDPEIHPQPETYFGNTNPVGPRSCYDESKRFSESLTINYNWLYGVDTHIVRIFNTYGPGMRPKDGRVIPNFVNQALRNEDLTVYGDGLQTRSYCYVSDLIEAMHLVMTKGDERPYNIGNPDEYTILQTAQEIIKFTGSQSKIVHLGLPKDDPKKRRPDITRLQEITGFQPRVSFEDGIARTVEYFKSL